MGISNQKLEFMIPQTLKSLGVKSHGLVGHSTGFLRPIR